mmetsp:Transcript_67512/g.112241  ORF Transcript_67512/g.112241 Transcript_67512/m.112241 type:complete len:243 (+) Transcript_67512:196-924(+)
MKLDRELMEDLNVCFYAGKCESRPNGALIDEIHESWHGQFELLEEHHGYIQWLFPVFENAGMNWESQPLSKKGAAKIREDPVMSWRVVRSYKLMLHFYGLQLADQVSGLVERDDDAEHATSRLQHLNSSPHNWLRVSRIITSLGELGFRRYKNGFLNALEREVRSGLLSRASQSFYNFWQPLVLEEASARYAAKTLESPEDRNEGCLFTSGAISSDVEEVQGGGAALDESQADKDAAQSTNL